MAARSDGAQARRGGIAGKRRALPYDADTAPVLIWTMDADKLCTYVSQTWLDLTGRIFEEELGNGWADDIHPSDRDARLEAYAHCFDQRSPFTLEYRVRRHDGEYRWLLDKGTPRFASDRISSATSARPRTSPSASA
jgi:PAS domain S-box-containing protein